MERKKRTTVFDHNECYKCGGTGYISAFSHVWGGGCFPCEGRGFKLTRHGKADAARYRAAIDEASLRKVADVQVGDHVKLTGDNKYAIVKAITPKGTSGASHLNQATGEWVKDETPVVEIQLDRKVIDLVLAGTSVPRDMVVHDGYNVPVTMEIYIHPDSELRNPQGERRATGKVNSKGNPVTRWYPTNPRMPKPEAFVTPKRTRKAHNVEAEIAHAIEVGGTAKIHD